MRDTELYAQVLGDIDPWRVARVTLNQADRIVEVELVCDGQVWVCPECQQRAHLHGYESRRWRHLDTCQYQTILSAAVPRVKCATHGTVAVRVPWAAPHGRFTKLFERLAIDVMQECSTQAATAILGISWDEADGIKQRAVQRGLARRGPVAGKRLGIDEKAAGHGHDYVTVISCADTSPARVLAVEDGRETSSLSRFWRRLTRTARAGIEVLTMDMWEPYYRSALRFVPGAASKIVYDRFHLAGHLNQAVDEVRRREQATVCGPLGAQLKGSRHLWLYAQTNVPRKWAGRFRELCAAASKTARAWKVKELFREFWACADAQDGAALFKKWYNQAVHSRLEPVKRVARMLRDHLPNLLTWFAHRASNAAAEGLNSRIQHLVQQACGYRNRARFKADILFHFGGLDLYPT